LFKAYKKEKVKKRLAVSPQLSAFSVKNAHDRLPPISRLQCHTRDMSPAIPAIGCDIRGPADIKVNFKRGISRLL